MVENILYNRDIEDVTKFLDDTKQEMLSSQSSRLHRGFIPEEKRRYVELLNSLAKRIEALDTGDFPEVHPHTIAGGGGA